MRAAAAAAVRMDDSERKWNRLTHHSIDRLVKHLNALAENAVALWRDEQGVVRLWEKGASGETTERRRENRKLRCQGTHCGDHLENSVGDA
jgi:hypothetical protein